MSENKLMKFNVGDNVRLRLNTLSRDCGEIGIISKIGQETIFDDRVIDVDFPNCDKYGGLKAQFIRCEIELFDEVNE